MHMKLKTQVALAVAASIAGLALLSGSEEPRHPQKVRHAAQRATSSVRSKTVDPASLAEIAPLDPARSEAGRANPDPGVARAVSDLALAIQNDDGDSAGRIAVEVFAQGPEAVRSILELAASDGLAPDEVRALGVLFKVGAHRLVDQPERLAPWTLDSFTTASLDLLSAHPQVPSLLYAGFCDVGLHLEAVQLPKLLDAFRSQEVGPPSESQFPCLELAKRWAVTMDGSVEPILLERTLDPSRRDIARADAAAMLLCRDWRRTATELATHLESESLPKSKALRHVVCSHVLQLEPIDQANYFELLGGAPHLALAIASQMDPSAADLAIDRMESDEQGQFQRAVLRLRAGAFEDVDEIFGLLADRQRAAELPQLTTLALGALVHSDAAFEDGLSARLLDRFAATDAEKESLLRVLIKESRTMDDARVFAVVLPILDLMRADTTRGRAVLAATVTQRFPELRFD